MSDFKGLIQASRSGRREFLKHASALGLSVTAATGLFATLGRGPAFAAESAEKLEPLLEAAKAEGAVVAGGNSIQSDECANAMAKGFREFYGLPDSFEVGFTRKSVGPLQKQVEEEIAAERVSFDVCYMNVAPWAHSLAERGLLIDFDAPEYEAYAWQDDKPAYNNQPYYVSDINILASICWNTDIIKGNDFKSWWDVIKPEYAGKLSTLSARLASSFALNYQAMRKAPDIGDKFFEELAKLNPTTVKLTSLAMAKVVSGEYPIAIGISTRPYSAWKNDGVRNIAQSYPKEGVVPLAVSWIGLKNCPHPNAAKLLLNFSRSKEGQTILADYEGRMSGRRDIKSPNPEFVPSVADLNLLPVDLLGTTKGDFKELAKDWVQLFGV